MAEEIRLDEATHTYHREIGGGEVRVPGVTEIMRDLGIQEPSPFFTEEGRAQGVALHEFALFLAANPESKIEDPDPRIAGRVEGFRKFMAESRFQFVDGEKVLYHSNLGYCGKPDLWGHLGSFSVVLDVKRGAKMKWHALQLSAYKLLLADNGFQAQKRFGLYLKDGGYTLTEYADKRDEANWKALVYAYAAKEAYRE